MGDNEMKEMSTELKYNDTTYHLVFNLNVMEEIQDEYGTLDKWGKLTDGTIGEPNAKALIFGLTAMLNEGIDIDNEKNNTDIKPLTKKQVGRILSKIGLEEATKKLNDTVIESTKSEEKNV
jgi:hypothetical protein